MNMLIQGVTVTHKDGKVLSLEQVYIRGSQVGFRVQGLGFRVFRMDLDMLLSRRSSK